MRNIYRSGPLLSDDLTKNEVEQLFESTKRNFMHPENVMVAFNYTGIKFL